MCRKPKNTEPQNTRKTLREWAMIRNVLTKYYIIKQEDSNRNVQSS